MSFKAGYEKLFRETGIELQAEDGCDEDSLIDAESRLGVQLPAALRAYYAKAGRHPINQAHNRLIDLEKLTFAGEQLLFLEDGSDFIRWGVPRTCLGEDNPTVWQGENGRSVVWQSEELAVSDFVEINLYWQAACGGLKFSGTATELGADIVALVEKHWPTVRSHNKMRFFVKQGQILVLNDEPNGTFSLLAAGTSLEHFDAINEALAVDWDWSILDELEDDEDDE